MRRLSRCAVIRFSSGYPPRAAGIGPLPASRDLFGSAPGVAVEMKDPRRFGVPVREESRAAFTRHLEGRAERSFSQIAVRLDVEVPIRVAPGEAPIPELAVLRGEPSRRGL